MWRRFCLNIVANISFMPSCIFLCFPARLLQFNQYHIMHPFRPTSYACENWACITMSKLDILFPSNHNIHKSSCGLCFWASDPFIDRFYKNLSIKGSEAQKQRPHKLLWMLWFDKKSISNLYIFIFIVVGSASNY